MLYVRMEPLPQGPEVGDVTRCLGRLALGDSSAEAELLELVYGELRRAAAGAMGRERAAHTLEPTALVHEAWVRLFGGGPAAFEGRAHFLRAAARAMRRVLIDHARARGRRKREGGQGQRQPLEDWLVVVEARQLDLVALDDALAQLEAADEDLARLVELRFFGGLSIAETAAVLGRSTASVERDWRVARALLRRSLDDGAEPGNP